MSAVICLAGCGTAAGSGSGSSGAADTGTAETAPSGENTTGTAGWESFDDNGSADSTDAADQTDGSGTTEDAAENSTALVLSGGEEALLNTGEVSIPFQGTVPDLSVNWNSMDNVAAWLVIPGTNINTGIRGSETDDAVWIDANSMPDFTDPMTVLHGSCAAGGPLEQVQDYADADFFAENPYVYIYRPDGEVIEYRVFASYEHETEDILVEHNAFDYDEFTEYINDIFNQRSMTAVTDETMKDEAISSWQVLTIDCDEGTGTDFLLQATLTGEGKK